MQVHTFDNIAFVIIMVESVKGNKSLGLDQKKKIAKPEVYIVVKSRVKISTFKNMHYSSKTIL